MNRRHVHTCDCEREARRASSEGRAYQRKEGIWEGWHAHCDGKWGNLALKARLVYKDRSSGGNIQYCTYAHQSRCRHVSDGLGYLIASKHERYFGHSQAPGMDDSLVTVSPWGAESGEYSMLVALRMLRRTAEPETPPA